MTTPLIDAHCHWFSRPFFQALAGESSLPGSESERMTAVQSTTGLEFADENNDTHREHWLAEIEGSPLDRMVIFSSHPTETMVVAEAIAAAPDRLTGVAVVNPMMEGAHEKVRALVEKKGFRGILLFPAQHGYRVDDAAVTPVLAAVAAVRGLCYVHCGLFQVPLRDRFAIPRTANPSLANPLFLVPAADRHPEATFVIPHFGAGMFRETLLAGMQCGNIVTDSSSSNGWIKSQPAALTLKDVFARTLDALGPERLLFGTDSSTFPMGWRQDRFEEQTAILSELGASAEERALVLGGNAARLLGL